jgi:AcrR family transcriptional regulator
VSTISDLPNVALRVEPQQARARHAIDTILRATGELLDEVGYDTLTTKTVAERAGVNIATVYRYFPDKRSLAHSLAARHEAEYTDRFSPHLLALATADDWRTAIRHLTAEAMRMRVEQPGMDGMRRPLSAGSELSELQRHIVGGLVDSIADVLRTRRPELTVKASRVLAATVQASTDAVLALRLTALTTKQATAQAADVAIGYLGPALDA